MAIPTDDNDILVFMAMMAMIPEKGEMELPKSWRWGECDSALTCQFAGGTGSDNLDLIYDYDTDV